MDVQLKRERQEWTSKQNALQQDMTKLKDTAQVCTSFSCSSVLHT